MEKCNTDAGQWPNGPYLLAIYAMKAFGLATILWETTHFFMDSFKITSLY
jgi:hypothetical protein